MSDIVERLKLRALAFRGMKRSHKEYDAAMDDAAAAEIERLRAALRDIEEGTSCAATPELTAEKFRSRARQALQEDAR
jgi:hypothetical protein